ncbi:MAG: DUF6036 family nucleotidyltransferase [Candidatus Nanopelagicales bacterium]|nr:DUF6036 family nucleotidyltransferase [Candidatus Nanopelagicales bacterium]
MTTFDRGRIQELMHALDHALARRGTTADMYLVGGAAIALTFDSARTTRDLDAVFAPATDVRAAAGEVAAEFGLPEDWLNDAVKGFVPPTADPHQQVIFESAHLRVCVAGAEHLLAMKIAASRVEQDRGDLELLVNALGIATVEQALDIARACLGPGYPIPPRAQYLLGEILDETTVARDQPRTEPMQGQHSRLTPPPTINSRYEGPSLT